MKTLRAIKSGLPGAALALCLWVLLLAVLLYVCGTCAPLMEHMMRTFAPAQATGLPEADYAPMARMITGYLAGSVPQFQYTLTLGDTQYPVFHVDEQLHMADCLSLFVLCRRVLIASAVLTVVCAVLTLRGDRRSHVRGFFAGTLLVTLCCAAVGIAAAVDFDSLFVLFHRLSFANDMWLLDPRTDMLIRLMPLDFFIRYVVIIGGVWGGSLLAALGVSAYGSFRKQKPDQGR